MDLNAIREHLLEIGGEGRNEDGAVNRLLFTPAYDRAAEKLMAYMRQHTGIPSEIFMACSRPRRKAQVHSMLAHIWIRFAMVGCMMEHWG